MKPGNLASRKTYPGTIGSVFIRTQWFAREGDFLEGHKHNFDHVTVCWQGGIHVRIEETGEEFEVRPKDGEPGWVNIKAGLNHHITALEDNTRSWCVFAHRDGDGEVIDVPGNVEAYS